ncbi:MAG: large conductance mechanosensitive channel protein MscL [Anaerolineae bacterium]
MLAEFKAFALKGSVIDLAIAVVIGGAFGKIIGSFVTDIIMPLIGLLRPGNFSELFIVLRQGATGGPYPSLAAAAEAGAVTMNIGVFLDTVILFILVAIVLFFVIKALNATKKKEEAPALTTKQCPYCLSDVPLAATRCPHCTSQLPAA